MDVPKKLRKLMSIAAGWREGNIGRGVDCGEERASGITQRDEGECARRALRDDTAGALPREG